MMASVEALKKIFDPLPPSLRWLRNFGMTFLIDKSKLKNKSCFMRWELNRS